MEDKVSVIIEDMKWIQEDITNICEVIKSSPLTKSTKKLIEVLESIRVVLKEKE